ncbi:protein-glutamine gamma-glutamyltransferase E-like [Pseudophryne corroboree]|uniref:protein-glutamine gamma-glutamyltransferase E-like n=1 Tax=Pseudophryne corroboree TaxID=495146 RepID=UPI003081EE4A
MAALKLKTFSMEEALNMEEHRTDYYNSSKLILRRGQKFRITLHFNRPIQKGDQVQLIAATGPAPLESDNTLAVFQLSGSTNKTSWTAVKDSSSTADVKVIVTSPADAPIGCYKMSLCISYRNKQRDFRLKDVILLFNPWATDDNVFMEDENERLEYVLNDNGVIFYGLLDSIKPMGWNFGQFEDGILDICFQILNKSLSYEEDNALDCSKRGDPGYVGRVLSAMINSFDDEGVLEGNWSNKMSGGVDPQDWSGSVDILIKWRKGGYKPVKYGQCWVFAGVMCTVLRCLGIPTRVVTNFASAHDKDANLSVDMIYSRTGKSLSKDSMWNYHAWNESWFKRRDLGSSYGGWQVLDATPQELSGGIHCCGPASVHAIKEGEIDLEFDGPFIYSEVNGDRITWVYYDKHVKEKVFTDTESVGKNISTKAVGSDERVDITDSYKYPEESAKERSVYLKARKKLLEMGIGSNNSHGKRGIGKKRRKYRNGESQSGDPDEEKEKFDIQGKFELTSSTAFGEDINLTLSLKNSTNKKQSVTIKLSSSTIEYTGRPVSEIFSDTSSLILPPMKEKEIPISISASDYEEELTNHNLIEVAALCELRTGKKMLVRKVIVIEQPPLGIQVYTYASVNNPLEVEITYTNPLSTFLNDGVLSVGGSGLVRKKLKKKVPKLKPNESRRVVVEITPYRSGAKQLMVDFTSKHFTAIKGFHSIEVAEEDAEEEESMTGE